MKEHLKEALRKAVKQSQRRIMVNASSVKLTKSSHDFIQLLNLACRLTLLLLH